MSTPVLIIKHASSECNVEQVILFFNNFFEEDIVKKVVESSHFDHKSFGIHFKKKNVLLDEFVNHINIFKIKHVCYDVDFYNKRYIWNVTCVNAMEILDATDKYTQKNI